MDMVPHATRTSLRRLLLWKGVEVPPVRELTLRNGSRLRAYAPTFSLRWRDSQQKHHLAIYYFCAGEPFLEVDGRTVTLTMDDVQIHGLYKEKE